VQLPYVRCANSCDVVPPERKDSRLEDLKLKVISRVQVKAGLNYFALPGRSAKHCDDHVCLSVRSRNSKTTRPNFNKFLCILTIAVARSSSGGVAICYLYFGFADDTIFSRRCSMTRCVFLQSGSRPIQHLHNRQDSNQILDASHWSWKHAQFSAQEL